MTAQGKMDNVRILIVEDEPIIALDIQKTLLKMGYEVAALVSTGEAAVEKAGETSPTIVLMDIMLAGAMDGIEAATIIKNRYNIPVVYLTGNADTGTVTRARDSEPYGYVLKPVDPPHLFTTIDTSLQRFAMEERLRESELRLRNILDSTEDGYYEWHIPTDTVIITDRYVRMLGYEKDEIPCTFDEWTRHVHPDDLPAVVRKVRNHMEGLTASYEAEYRMKDRSGEWLWILDRGRIVERDSEGNPVKFSGAHTDITPRRKMEIALRESEEKYRAIVENTHDAIYIYQDDTFVYGNTRFCELSGYSLDEIMQKTFMDLVHPGDRERVIDIARRRARGDDIPSSYEARIIIKDGSVKHFEFNPTVIEYNGKYAVLGAASDITRRKQTEQALKESEEKYRSIFNNVQDVFYRTDLEGIITEISPSIFRESGYTREELIGRPVHMVYEKKEDRNILLNEIIQKGEVFDYDLRLRGKDGTLIYTSANAHLLFNDEGRPVGVEGSLRNVTGRRTAEDALKKSLKEKEVLLREIHHRVKNNFQIISSLLNLQTRGVQDEGILQQFNEIKSRIRSMSLIHEKLYQSKEISLIDFASYIGTISKELFRNYYTGSAHPEFIIETDPVLLTIDQAIPCGLIINELLTNTFKYAFPPHWEGKPVIRLALRLSDGEKVLLSVSDNGVGIPSHIDHRTTSSLGLSLITMLTAQIGGEIRIDRAAGTSAIITFSAKQQ